MRLLLVEDDSKLSAQLAGALRDAGYVVDVARDGEEGQYLGENEPYDAAILDLGLPKVDGVTILERLGHSLSDDTRSLEPLGINVVQRYCRIGKLRKTQNVAQQVLCKNGASCSNEGDLCHVFYLSNRVEPGLAVFRKR